MQSGFLERAGAAFRFLTAGFSPDPGAARVVFRALPQYLGRRWSWLLLSMWIALGAAIVMVPGVSFRFDQIIHDSFESWAIPGRTGHPDVVILAVDTESLDQVPIRWPWPGEFLDELVSKLKQAGGKTVILTPQMERGFLRPSRTGNENDPIDEIATGAGCGFLALDSYDHAFSENEKRRLESLHPNRIPISFGPDRDGFLRAVRVDPGKDCCCAPGGVEVALKQGGASADIFLSFLEGDRGIPFSSAGDFLAGIASSGAFLGKTVFVGPTANVLHDRWNTPRGFLSGVEILATAWENLLSGRRSLRLWDLRFRIPFGLLGALGGAVTSLAGGLPACGFVSLLILAAVSLGLKWLCMMSGYHFPIGVFLLSWAFVGGTTFLGRLFMAFIRTQGIRAEGHAVAELQRKIHPSGPWDSPEGYRCSGYCLPCEDAGGDFYDFFPQPDGTFLFFLGDVTGHGFPAGMVTTIAKSVLSLSCQEGACRPVQVLSDLNGVIFDLMKKSRKMTAAAGILDPRAHVVSIALAGHPPPFILKKDGTVQQVGKIAPPLGCFRDLKPGMVMETRTEFGEGDSLFLFTDGLNETLNWDNRQYGYATLQQFLSGKSGIRDHQDFYGDVLGEMRKFASGRAFSDDLTMVLLTRDPVKATCPGSVKSAGGPALERPAAEAGGAL